MNLELFFIISLRFISTTSLDSKNSLSSAKNGSDLGINEISGQIDTNLTAQLHKKRSEISGHDIRINGRKIIDLLKTTQNNNHLSINQGKSNRLYFHNINPTTENLRTNYKDPISTNSNGLKPNRNLPKVATSIFSNPGNYNGPLENEIPSFIPKVVTKPNKRYIKGKLKGVARNKVGENTKSKKIEDHIYTNRGDMQSNQFTLFTPGSLLFEYFAKIDSDGIISSSKEFHNRSDMYYNFNISHVELGRSLNNSPIFGFNQIKIRFFSPSRVSLEKCDENNGDRKCMGKDVETKAIDNMSDSSSSSSSESENGDQDMLSGKDGVKDIKSTENILGMSTNAEISLKPSKSLMFVDREYRVIKIPKTKRGYLHSNSNTNVTVLKHISGNYHKLYLNIESGYNYFVYSDRKIRNRNITDVICAIRTEINNS